MVMSSIKPINPVPQNNATPWLPPMKTLGIDDSTSDHRQGGRIGGMRTPPSSWPSHSVSGAPTLSPALSPALSPFLEAAEGVAVPDPVGLLMAGRTPAATRAVTQMAAPLAEPLAEQSAPKVFHLLELLQRQSDELKAKAMQNELLIKSMLSNAPGASHQGSTDHGLWAPMAGAATIDHYSRQFGGGHARHPMMEMAYNVPPLSRSLSASTLDYVSDGSGSGHSGKRSHRDMSPDSDDAGRKKRMYVRAACSACRVSHLACDESQPCRNCVRSGSHCVRVVKDKFYVPPSVQGQGATTESGDTDSNASEMGQTGRKYVKAACTHCRRSHLACDNYRPCRNCVRMGLGCEKVRSQRRSDESFGRRRDPIARLASSSWNDAMPFVVAAA